MAANVAARSKLSGARSDHGRGRLAHAEVLVVVDPERPTGGQRRIDLEELDPRHDLDPVAEPGEDLEQRTGPPEPGARPRGASEVVEGRARAEDARRTVGRRGWRCPSLLGETVPGPLEDQVVEVR